MVGYYPQTLEEALQLLTQFEDATIHSGGTDLMVQKHFAEQVIFINQIEELHQVSCEMNAFEIGAGATYFELIANSKTPDILKNVFSTIASPSIRNRGTVGGNINNASPAGDSLPILYGLHATVVLTHLNEQNIRSERRVPISEYILGIRKIDRKPNEIMTKIIIDQKYLNDTCHYYYKKVGARKSEAISKLSFFGYARVEDNKILDGGVAFGAVGITVVSSYETDEKLTGLDQSSMREQEEMLVAAYMEQVRPIDDQRSSAKYRKQVAENLLIDFLHDIEEQM